MGGKFGVEIVTEVCEICGERPGLYMIGGSLYCQECADQEAEDNSYEDDYFVRQLRGI